MTCPDCGYDRTENKTCRCTTEEHDFDNECNNCGECKGDILCLVCNQPVKFFHEFMVRIDEHTGARIGTVHDKCAMQKVIVK